MNGEAILIGHGGGGRLTRDLLRKEIVTRFGDGPLRGLPDAARLALGPRDIVFSTDGFVVQPLFFPGGDIGSLAVHGTVNDVAVGGGRPRYLSLGMVLEEGLPFDVLRRILDSVRDAACACDVQVATGDTKVVPRGLCDGVYLHTTGIGEALPEFVLDVERIRPGDRVLVSGELAQHGIAIVSAREGLGIENDVCSDSAPVHRLVLALREFGEEVRFLRDPTRGGLAAVLHEIVEGTSVGIELLERDLPFSPEARSIAELLGLDLLHVASEGRVVAIVAANVAERVLAAWRGLSEGRRANVVGTCVDEPGRVRLETRIGGSRLVDLPSGELLPRIC